MEFHTNKKGAMYMFKCVIEKDLELRLPNSNDAEKLFELIDRNKIHLSKWLPWVKHTKDVESIVAFIKDIQNDYISNNGFQAIIVYKGDFAGVIGYQGINWSRKSTTIGYWLGESFQGKEIMSKVLNTFIDYAFNELCLNKIEIKVAEENYKSRRLPEKYGFKDEGIIRDAEWLNDRYVNHILYGILESEWNKK